MCRLGVSEIILKSHVSKILWVVLPHDQSRCLERLDTLAQRFTKIASPSFRCSLSPSGRLWVRFRMTRTWSSISLGIRRWCTQLVLRWQVLVFGSGAGYVSKLKMTLQMGTLLQGTPVHRKTRITLKHIKPHLMLFVHCFALNTQNDLNWFKSVLVTFVSQCEVQ